ncbi:MAG: hypothetical protein HY916_08250 [Desulfovibrio sp.]|jgi:hypothetical protein|nr:hypothetical protein [Desulfovibrio sp.]
MNFRSLAARRKLAGLAGTLVICLSLALAVDGMIAGGRKDPTLYDLLPGQSINLTDPMPRGAEKLSDIAFDISSPELNATMVETFSGFWLGGTLWRADLTVSTAAAPGEYTALVRYSANGTEAAPRQAYRIRVHKDAASIQASALSLTRRVLGLSPYLLAVCLLPMAVLPMAASFILSRKIGQALSALGMAEVYRAMASPEGQRIFFSLPGPNLAPEGVVDVLDERGEKRLGAARVATVDGVNVEAIMQEGISVRPGVLVKPV